MSYLPGDFNTAITRTLSLCPSKCLWSVSIPSTKSFVLFPKTFSWPCLLVVACPSFLLISLSTVSLVPQHNRPHLSDCKWIELLERGWGSRPPSFLQQNLSFTTRSMSLLKHMASITGPLFPASASFLLPIPCPPLAAPAEIQHTLYTTLS